MKRLVLRVVGVGLLVLAALFVVHARGRARFVEAKARADGACRAWRRAPAHADADVCRYDAFAPSVVRNVKSAEEQLDAARASFARGEIGPARGALVMAMAYGTSADRHGTVAGSLAGAKIVRETLDVVDAHRAELGPHARMEILANAHLASAAHPLETARLQHAWALAHLDESEGGLPVPAATIADAIETDDAAYAAMDKAILRDDAEACVAAAGGASPLGRSEVEASICARLVEASATNARLEAATRAAIVDAFPTTPRG